jgi:hypothetical protein
MRETGQVLLNLPEAPVVVLVHSPLIGPAAWGEVPERLQHLGLEVTVLDIRPQHDDEAISTFISNAALAISTQLADHPGRHVALVGQHEAGPLLPHLGAAQTASGRQVAGYVFVNGLLPKPYGARGANSMLDLIEAGDSGRADALRGLLVDGVRFPNFEADDLAGLVPTSAVGREIVDALYPRDFAWYAAPLPATAEWPDAPVTYLHSAPECDWEARQAALRGWSVQECAGATFAALNAPDEVAAAIAKSLR